MNLIKSPNDKKEYRVITLENGLTAMLISNLYSLVHMVDQGELSSEDEQLQSDGSDHEDNILSSPSDVNTSDEEPDADDEKFNSQKGQGKNKMAAAALCIRVGSFSDPDDLPGLAHFLEHMIFMGNEKYPKENYFDAFVSKHGGSDNAYTDCERTVFHLDIRPKYLHEALDIFAACFASPLLKIDSMDREIEAVDSEFQLCSPRDSERIDLLLGHCASSGHPMAKFFCGNTKSLKVDPRLKDINVNEELQAFWRRHYSSHCMTLAVMSTESLDVLESWVREIFSRIPRNDLPPASFELLQEPFKADRFHKLYKIVPVKEMHRIVISWALPPLKQWYKVKPLGYLGWIIGHEGKGSIIAYLRRRFLALQLEAGNSGYGLEFNSMCSLFRITIYLTETGMDDILEVISVVFQYLKMLRDKGPQCRIFQEVKDIENNLFRFQEEVDESRCVEEIAESMHCYPPEHYLVGDQLYFDYDEEILRSCEDVLTFENANIMILSSRFASTNICDEKEKWTQASYCSSDFPPEWVEHLCELDVHPDLHLPEENEYIAKIFDLKPEVAVPGHEYPVKIHEDEYGCLWYKKDKKFNVPKGYIYFHLMSPVIRSSAQNFAAMDLMMNCLNQILAEDLYPAGAANLSYAIYANDSGLILNAAGFDHKLRHLFEIMLDKTVNFSVTEELFTSMKSNLFKSYYNALIKPSKLCKDVRLAILHQSHWSVVDRRAALKEITKDSLMDFSRTFWSNVFIEGLIQGNFTSEEALSINALVKAKTGALPLSIDCFPQLQTAKIPCGETFCRVSSFCAADVNSVVINYYQSGPGKIKTSCIMELLLDIMSEPCFDVLRTKESLGYDVSCEFKDNFGIIGFFIDVKSPSNKFSCSYIDERIEAFLQTFAFKIQNLSEEEFNVQRASLIDVKRCDDLNLKDEVNRNWKEIIDKNYLFDRLVKEIECLQSLTLGDLKSFAQNHLSSDGSKIRKLSVQVVGGGTTDKVDSFPAQSNILCKTHTSIVSANGGNVNDTVEGAYTLNYLRSPISDNDFISDITEYKSRLEMYASHKIVT